MPHCDVVIVGAGVIGSSIAYHLGKRGMHSTVVERESIGTRASGKAWAVISYPPTLLAEEMVHSTVDDAAGIDFAEMPEGDSVANWLYLFSSSYERMPDLALEILERGGIDIEYGESPNTLLLTEADIERCSRDDLLAPYLRAGGIETGWLDASQLREAFPSLESKWVAGITNPEGQVESYKFTLGLAQAAERLGARIKQGDAVGFATRGDRITGLKLASGETLEADHFVIAAGPWSRPVASHLGIDVPMQLLMTECVRVEVPGGLPFQTLVAGDYWIIPKLNGEVILSPYVGSLSLRDDFDASLTDELRLRTVSACAEILPALEDAKLLEHRGDLLAIPTSAPYQKPLLGRIPQWQNGYLATHFGGLGINMSPAAGELMAEFIATGRPPLRAAQTLAHLAPRN
ncbi:MAG: FAD-binding oxidoreductase [Deltaproteobacteria bacterium]|jgi:glycine oxidase|nr:FAD-binding oxidoreductase [Deltaproteobacteria bacterium]